jgi:photosystem II stability/assembly factor-like uncharacterized protein
MRIKTWFAIPVVLALVLPLTAAEKAEEEDRLSSKTFAGLELRSIGPALMSGRIADIAIDPTDQSTWYVAVGSGGVWKTTNAGTTWKPIFDDQTAYSIGCLTIDPGNPAVIWVGTGENVGGRHVGFGDGVYKSLDGGGTWEKMGLERSEHIGRIVVDPTSSATVYVAVQGPLWSAGGERGLYKTTDGGVTWVCILSAGEYTGVNDIVIDSRDPDVLYAATHQRMRNVAVLINGGPESGIHKSNDGGATWRKLTHGLPKEDMGRIGLAISPQNPDVVYATIELAHRNGGFYRSADRGATWEKRNDYHSGGTGPHYYQEIFASPHAFDRVYQMDVWMRVTHDGGKTFERVGEKDKHVDNHALAFNPDDPDYLIAGCDGGLYESWDLGKHWRFIANLPVTQFYKVALDSSEPFYYIYGGTQDNATQGGPSRTDNLHGIRNSDWFITTGGDGHQPAVDPENPNIVYSESQQGYMVRHDRKTGEVVPIRPQPAQGEPPDRFNWDSPILISPHNPARLFFASQRLWRSDDRGDSWTAISGDLSRGEDRLTLPIMGRVWSYDSIWDLGAMSKYGTITSIAQSPVDEQLLWVGTDDGLVQVSENGGDTWRKIDKLPGVPEYAFVNDIKADLFDPDTVYVALDHHKAGVFKPFLLKSSNRGKSWASIAGDLPDRHLVWRLVQDHEQPELLFAGNEMGVFFTIDGGAHWIELSGGVPTIPFRDLAIQRRESDLVGATFGRGFFVLDDYSPLRTVSEELLEEEVVLFDVRKAWWYSQRWPLGGGDKGDQGSAYFTAPNPPFGAIFTYYLRDAMQTRKQVRREQEKEIEKEGGDTPYPGWDELRREAQEEEPAIVLIVRDADGNTVRRVTGATSAGFHRVAWDLRYPNLRVRSAGERDPWDNDDGGFLAAPGTYSVTLARRINGVLTEVTEPKSFQVVQLREGSLPGSDAADTAAYGRDLAELDRNISGINAAIGAAMERIEAIKEALGRSAVDGGELDGQVRAIESALREQQRTLNGERGRWRMGDEGDRVSISTRMRIARSGLSSPTYGPTASHRHAYEIAVEELVQLQEALRVTIDEELPTLEERLEEAGVPWTPGRKIPVLR